MSRYVEVLVAPQSLQRRQLLGNRKTCVRGFKVHIGSPSQ